MLGTIALSFIFAGLFVGVQKLWQTHGLRFQHRDRPQFTGAAERAPAPPPTGREETPLTSKTLTGAYVIGVGPSRVELGLAEGGTFAMKSPSGFGRATEVQGQWRLGGSQIILWTMNQGQPFRWSLGIIPRGGGFDLVPNELLETYQENPLNKGSRYRRVSKDASSLLAADFNSGSGSTRYGSAPAEAEGRVSSEPEEKRIGPAPVEPQAIVRSKPTASSRQVSNGAAPASIRQHDVGPFLVPKKTAVTRIVTLRDLSIFVFRPAPVEPLGMRALNGPGLARVSVDERGVVVAVEILQSTGQRQFDADAADTLRRWRTRPGPPREVEIALTSVISGKRIPRDNGAIRQGS
ncbi:MAG: TonB family protein [Chthoniobacterales bacterium]|nr:TonB family protein [Chthoniobacterales bacterium]